jgi:hypothetical protein
LAFALFFILLKINKLEGPEKVSFFGEQSIDSQKKKNLDLEKGTFTQRETQKEETAAASIVCAVRSGSSINCWVSPRMTKLFASYAPCLRQSALCFGDWVSQARALPLDPAVVNVAWHIRVGSGGYYYTTSSSFYREVLGFMAPFLRGRKCVHHLIGGAGWDRENGEYVAHIGSIISDLGLSAVSQVSPLFLSVKDSFLYLMSADVAISTSSSFSDIAALFSSFPVFISPPPKHGTADNWFEFLPDAVYVDGSLYKQKQSGYITNVWRAAGVSPFQAVNDTLHQRLAARFPLAARDAPS